MNATVLLLTVLLASPALAQVVPATPTRFGKRELGGGTASASTNVQPPTQQTIVRTITYLSLSESRQWTNHEGKSLLAKLIAFEDITEETVQGASQATGSASQKPPAFKGKPTVVRDGKIRLLANQRPYEVVLESLSPTDREFVEKIKPSISEAK